MSNIERLFSKYNKTYWDFVSKSNYDERDDDQEEFDRNVTIMDQLSASRPDNLIDCCVLLSFARDLLRRVYGDRFGNLPDDMTGDVDNVLVHIQRHIFEVEINALRRELDKSQAENLLRKAS